MRLDEHLSHKCEARRLLRDALERLCVRDDQKRYVWSHALMIQTWAEYERIGGPYYVKDASRRKPVAWATTECVAEAYEGLTGKRVTRISRQYTVDNYTDGSKEDGAFAAFLAEVFAILNIKASSAGQVALLMKARRRR